MYITFTLVSPNWVTTANSNQQFLFFLYYHVHLMRMKHFLSVSHLNKFLD